MTYQLEELSIELTNECRLSCLHCSSGSTMRKMKDELTPLEHLSLIGQARKMGATVLSLSGGEPLLYSHITTMLHKAEQEEYERVLIYTTGYHRTGDCIDTWEHIKWVMERCERVTWIFSFHSHDHGVNDYIMNMPGALHNIRNSIFWLTEQGADVEVHMVPMKPNYPHITQVMDACEELGVSKLSLLRFVPQTRGLANLSRLAMDKGDFMQLQWIMVQALDRDSTVELRLGCPIDFRHMCWQTKAKVSPCHAGDDLILVRPTGDVHPCAAWKSLPADVNVRKHDLEWIWEHSEVFNAIREFTANGYKRVLACMTCPMVDSCKTGCPAQRLHAAGRTLDDLYSPLADPLCSMARRGNDKL